MSRPLLAIGEVSKRTGMPVKTLRFYADEGLVPPSGRSASGYRLYAEADVVKLELVRTLRDAGLGLHAIRSVLGRDLSLSEALRLRLGAIEAHITSLQQVAAALRVALRSEPTEQDIRRLTMVTKLSEEERKSLIERFQQRLVEGIPLDQKSIREKMAASAPRLPEDPTPEQLDAWVELAELMSDASFVEAMRDNTREVSLRGLDLTKLQSLNVEMGAAALLAQDAGTAPDSAGGRALVERYLSGLAELSGQRAEDPAFRDGVRQYFDRQDPRKTRYAQLVSILNGSAPVSSMVAGWGFMVSALRHHLSAS
ncbi:MAG TPA: MerR family transcriptional regulator [Polyangiaceae bacterium]|nr:MerR family transcriptional regulator [Polyangiaceae bacterium]